MDFIVRRWTHLLVNYVAHFNLALDSMFTLYKTKKAWKIDLFLYYFTLWAVIINIIVGFVIIIAVVVDLIMHNINNYEKWILKSH